MVQGGLQEVGARRRRLSKSTQHVSANGNNPYYTAYEQLNKLDRDRVFGNLAATINFTEELSLILRCGMDLNNDFRTQQKPKGAKTYINGMYKEQTVFDYEMNNDFLLRYTKKLNDFDLSASFGGNNMMQSYRSNTSLAESLVVDRDYRLSNSVDRPKVTSIRRQKSINSFYGLISASWRNMIFLDVTGRNDWSSTLAPGNNSYFYPSVSGSVILSDLLHIDTPMVNFLKVRASWANVGNDTSPYQLLNYYNNSSFTGGFNMPTNKANYNLKPENVESWEFGVEGRFFDSRLTFDVAFYNATTTNQIISVPVDITTGVYNTIVNAGEINNRGWEVSARIQPVRNKNIRWDMNFTWSRNRNKVVELAPNLDSWTIATGPRGEIRAVPGGSLGDLYGSGYEKAPKGSYVTADDGSTIDVSGWDIVDSDGYPVLASEFENLGNTQADWKAGWMNSISYKNFRLSFSFSAQWGGQAYSFTNAMLGYQGKIKATLPGPLRRSDPQGREPERRRHLLDQQDRDGQHRELLQPARVQPRQRGEQHLQHVVPEDEGHTSRIFASQEDRGQDQGAAGRFDRLLRHEPLLLDQLAAVRPGDRNDERFGNHQGFRNRGVPDDTHVWR